VVHADVAPTARTLSSLRWKGSLPALGGSRGGHRVRPATEQPKPPAVFSAGITWPSEDLWYHQSPDEDHHSFFWLLFLARGATSECFGRNLGLLKIIKQMQPPYSFGHEKLCKETDSPGLKTKRRRSRGPYRLCRVTSGRPESTWFLFWICTILLFAGYLDIKNGKAKYGSTARFFNTRGMKNV